MAQVFDIVAQLNIQGPRNLPQVLNGINQQLRGANTTISIDSSGSRQGIARLNSGLGATQAALRRVQSQAATMNATLAATVRVTQGGVNQLENFASQAGLATRRFVAFSAAAGSLITFVRAFQQAVTAAVRFDVEMNKIAQVSGDTTNRISEIRTEINRLSTSLGVSSQALAESAVVLKQAGLASTEIKVAMEALARSDLAPNFESIKQTTEGLIAVWRQFKTQAADFNSVLGSMNAVAGAFAVESRDLITAIQKAGGAFVAVAGDAKTGQEALAEFMGLFTSVRATTRESADTIATGLRTIFTRLQRSDTVQAVRELGINLRYTAEEARALGDINLENQFVGAYEAVNRLSTGLAGLRETDTRFAAVVEQLGGYRQISKVIPLLKENRVAQEAVNVAMTGQISLLAAAEARQETLANKTARLGEEYLKLIRGLVDSKGFQGLANSLITIAGGFAKILEYAQPLVPVLAAIAAVKIGTSLGGATRAFVNSLTAQVGKPIRGFARGGVVPGVGDSDTVPAVLTPGEFIIRKSSARQIGYDRLTELNEGRVQRFARGGQANTLMGSAPGGPSFRGMTGRKHTSDGFVLNNDTIKKALLELSQNSGIDFRKLVRTIDVVDTYDKSPGARGVYRQSKDVSDLRGTITLAKSKINSFEQLKYTLAHELGHAADNYLDGWRGLASKRDFTSAHRYGRIQGEITRRRDRADRLNVSAQMGRYRYAAHEGFADLFAQSLTGMDRNLRENTQLDSLRQRGFQRNIIERVALSTNANYKPKDLGFFGNLARGKGWVGGITRWLGFASGGSVDRSNHTAFVEELRRRGVTGPLSRNIWVSGALENSFIKRHGFENTAMLAGAGPDDIVHLNVSKDSRENYGWVNVRFRHKDDLYSAKRMVTYQKHSGVDPSSSPYEASINNSIFVVNEDFRQSGSASRMLARQALASLTGGFVETPKMSLLAARGEDFQGYYVWPTKFGANGRLDRRFIGSRLRSSMATAVKCGLLSEKEAEDIIAASPRDVRSLLAMPGGERYWKAKGNSFSAIIDPADPIFQAKLLQRKFAMGGMSPSDTVPALLTPGEFVINKEAASRIGLANLNHMNQTGKVRGYAKGGKVSNKDESVTGTFEFGDFKGNADIANAVRAEAAKLKVALTNATQIVLEMTKAGPVFKGLAQAAQEATQSLKQTDKGKQSAADILSRMTPQQAALYAKFEGKGIIDRAIGRVAGGSDPTGILYETGSRALARAVIQHQGDPKDFRPWNYVRRGIYSKIRDISETLEYRMTSAWGEEMDVAGKGEGGAAGLLQEQRSAEIQRLLTKMGVSAPTNYNELKSFAKKLGLPATGTNDALYSRIGEELDRQLLQMKAAEAPPPVKLGSMKERLAARRAQAGGGAQVPPNQPPAPPAAGPPPPPPDPQGRPPYPQLGYNPLVGLNPAMPAPAWLNQLPTSGRASSSTPSESGEQAWFLARLPNPAFAAKDPVAVRYQEQMLAATRAVNLDKAVERQLRQGRNFERAQAEAAASTIALLRLQRQQNNPFVDPLYLKQYAKDTSGMPGSFVAYGLPGSSLRQKKLEELEAYKSRPKVLGISSTAEVNPALMARDPRAVHYQEQVLAAARAAQAMEKSRQRQESNRYADPLYVKQMVKDSTGMPGAYVSQGLPGTKLRAERVKALDNYKFQMEVKATQKDFDNSVKRRDPGFNPNLIQSDPEAVRYQEQIIANLAGEKMMQKKEERYQARNYVDPLRQRQEAMLQDQSTGAAVYAFGAAGSKKREEAVAKMRQKQEEKRQAQVRAQEAQARYNQQKLQDYRNDPGVVTMRILEQFRNSGSKDMTPFLEQAKGSLSPTQLAILEKRMLQSIGLRSESLTQVNEAGEIVPTGGLASRAQTEANRRMSRLGGANNLSQTTQTRIQQEALAAESAKTERELYSAQRRLLAKLNPQMSAMELHRKATEDVAAAMSGQARVIRLNTGQIAGLESTVRQANTRGIDAPLAGGLGYRLGGMAGAVGNWLTTPSRLAQRLDNSPVANIFSGPGAIAAMMAVPAMSAFFDNRAGRVEDAVTAGSTSYYANNRAISGGLQGALVGGTIGATVGSMIPLVGTVIGGAAGAIVGGVAGVVSALRESADEIRQVKINNALTIFSDKIQQLANLGPATDGRFITAARDSLRTARAEAFEKNRIASTYFFSGYDPKGFGELQARSLRQDFGQQLPSMMSYLQRNAESLGRAQYNGDIGRIIQQLRASGDGLNDELVRLIASIRGLSIDDVFLELRKSVLQGQQATLSERRNLEGRQTDEKNINSFGRLLLAVQSASDSLLELRQRGQALAEVFDGTIGASRVSIRAENLDQLGRLDRGGLQPLQTVAAIGGEMGARLLNTGTQVDNLSRVLPGILATVVAGAQNNSEADVVTQVDRLLRERLGDDTEARVARASVRRRLNEELSSDRGGLTNLINQVQVDTTALSGSLLQNLAEPLKNIGGKVARQLEDNANQLTEQLTQLTSRLRQIGESFDQLASVQTSRFRQNLEVMASRAGRGNQALDFAGLEQLEFGQRSRQSRLAGVAGPAAFDPILLGRRLGETRAQLLNAERNQQQEFIKTGGRGPAFAQAAEEVLRLKSRAADLQTALRNLTDVTNQTSVAQEKLSRLQQEKEGRLGLAERFATAGPEEMVRMNRGLLLANEAARQGNLDNFSADDRRSIIETLRSAGGVTLTGFAGSPRADDLLKNLLSNSFGGAFRLNDGQQQEERQLQDVIGQRFKAAEDATIQLIQFQQQNSAEFFRNLGTQQEQFFARLEAILLKERLVEAENRQGILSAQSGRLGRLANQRDMLAGIGVTTTDQYVALQNQRGSAESLIRGLTQRSQINTARERALADVDNVQINGNLPQQQESLFRWLQNQGVDQKSAQRIAYERFAKVRTKPITPEEVHTPDGYNRVLRDDIRKAIKLELGDAKAGGEFARVNQEIETAIASLRGIRGLDTAGLEKRLQQGGPRAAQEFLEALNAFNTTDNRLENLGTEINKVNSELKALADTIARLRQQIPGGNVPPQGAPARLATGGNVAGHPGSPLGTDTVPAWLTPGEFVVNRRSAQANAGLLRRINSSTSPVYLARGGTAELEEQLRMEAAINPFGASAMVLQGWVANNYIRNNLFRDRKFNERQKRFFVAAQVGQLAMASQMENFIQRSSFGGLGRPGEDGQRNIAMSLLSREGMIRKENASQSREYQRWLRSVTQPGVVMVGAKRPLRMATGGPVPGSGIFDTVPALLTPGEFVLNRRAASGLGAPTLERLNQGGAVGGQSIPGPSIPREAIDQLSRTLNAFVRAAGGFGEVVGRLSQGFTSFLGSANALADAISRIPQNITLQGTHQVNVNINGAEVLSRISPEIQAMITKEVRASLNRIFREQMPDSGVNLD
jgi:hypothetical protein